MFWRKETGQTPSYQGAKPTIEISNPEFQLSVRYLKLTPEQLEVLQEIKPIIERYAEQAVSEFYSHLQTIPEMKKFIQENTTVERLGQTMKQYLLSLTPMRIDDSYIENRKMVGQVHDRINLPPYWYTSAYQFHYNFFVPKIIDAFAGQPERAKKAVQAFLTITNFDQQLGMSSYIQHYTAGLSKKDELEQILGDLQSLQNRVNDASQSLAATAEETAAAAAHMSSASDRIAENVTQAKEHTSEVVDQAKKGEAELRKAVEAFKELAEMLSLMRNKITTLDESSEKIDSIANVIRGIASQTNLLALNAAIESARAGEHGRGFSVVAQEVKKLAGSSEQSVQEITDMIGQSRVHTSEVSQAMAETLKSMEYMEEMVDKVVQAFTFILSSVASNEEQMAFVSQEVQNLSATAKEIEGASESVAHAAEDLSLMAH